MFAVGREYPVNSCELQSRARHECGQAGDKVERVENDMGGAVSKRLLERIDDLSPLVG